MRVFRSAAIIAPLPRRPVSAKTLRMWCAPEVILGVTTLSDEQVLLPHLINQARHSGAMIVLAHAGTVQGGRGCRKPSQGHPTSLARETKEALDRMARQLRWMGFTCEPVMLGGPAELEIPYLVRSCGADRVLLGFEQDPDLTTRKLPPVVESVMRGVDVPVCAIGRNAMHSSRTAIRHITLAISAESRCEVPLSFACRLAQEHRAILTLFHVSEAKYRDAKAPTHQELIARLPFSTWREAELFCPMDIQVRQGEPVDEILNYCASAHQDLLILCSPGNTLSERAWRDGVCCQAISGAPCPVIIAGSGTETAVAFNITGPPGSSKFSPQGEQIGAGQGREAFGFSSKRSNTSS